MAVLGCPARYVTLESLNLTSGAREGAIITASLIFSDFQVKMLQGNIDISFRVKGHKGAGTVYFTSIRRERGGPFTTLRFKVIADDGTVILIPCEISPTGDEAHAS
jgi:hypothetical protein